MNNLKVFVFFLYKYVASKYLKISVKIFIESRN